MCGFAGFLDSRRSTSSSVLCATVRDMADALRHRGPDDAGEWCDPAAGLVLGFRRLSIIDLSPLGHQPMVSASGRYVTTFNGEVYNFRELRSELASLGHAFAGHSDTEVILAAVERWGVQSAVQRFNGMFAIALWDTQDQALWLIRDRIGKKPLYYGWFDSELLFASELKALRRHPRFEGEISTEALSRYVRKGYVPGPLSIYQGVRKVLPGTILRFDANRPGGAPETFVYFDLMDVVHEGRRNPSRGDEAALLDALEEQLQQAVSRRMVADVPLGAFLSGGIDSSLVVALMQRHSDRPVKTFTIGFREEAFDEAAHARAVAAWLKTDHTELYVTPSEAMAVVPDLPSIYDEPFADSSQIPMYLVSALARSSVTVALSGDGGDELFGGYNRHVWAAGRGGDVRAIPRPLAYAAAAAISATSTHAWDRLYSLSSRVIPKRKRVAAFGEKMHKFARTLGARSDEELYEAITSFWSDDVLASASTGGEQHSEAQDLEPLAESMMFRDARGYLVDDILVKVDRATMAVSLEARAPFLDVEVMRAAWRLPLSLKIRNGQGKYVLRQLLDRHVPRQLIERPKVGFGVPLAEWLRGPLRPWAEELIEPRKLAIEGHFNPAVVQQRWQELLRGTGNWQHHVWIILMFQAWLRSGDVTVARACGDECESSQAGRR